MMSLSYFMEKDGPEVDVLVESVSAVDSDVTGRVAGIWELLEYPMKHIY